MTLGQLPRIDRLDLARITRVPDWHPLHDGFRPYPVHGWLIQHPDGPILFDCGIGTGVDIIETWYGAAVTPLGDALAPLRVETSDVQALVLSHLHFDHCGQQSAVAAPVYVQAAEREAARAAGYTVPTWADIPAGRVRLLDGDELLADGVRIVATPGHTPGHQSLLIDAADQRVLLAGQCGFSARELETGRPDKTNLHDPSWRPAAAESLARVRALGPLIAELSHDPARIAMPAPGAAAPAAGRRSTKDGTEGRP